MGSGTTLDDPVTKDQVPDLKASEHEINEYLNATHAYEVFSFLLKELMTKRPADPLQHMQDCLRISRPTGPLTVFLAGPPGLGRSELGAKLADIFGVTFISSGELLKEAGHQASSSSVMDDEVISSLVIKKTKEATDKLEGFILDGFPRTPAQAAYLKEAGVVPGHVILLKASLAFIETRNAMLADGELEGAQEDSSHLAARQRHFCSSVSPTFETYRDCLTIVDAEAPSEIVLAELAKVARRLPYSRGPRPLPRVVVLGPRGVGAAEHATRLALRLGAVLVDASDLTVTRFDIPEQDKAKEKEKKVAKEKTSPLSTARGKLKKSQTRMDLPNQEALKEADPLGIVGVRLRQQDCQTQGYVLVNFPSTAHEALGLQQDVKLCPNRIVTLHATEDVCVNRLRNIQTDPVTGLVWSSVPRNEEVRKRLIQAPQNAPAAVRAAYDQYAAQLPDILQAFGDDCRCIEISADGPPLMVFKDLADFVERPLPLQKA